MYLSLDFALLIHNKQIKSSSAEFLTTLLAHVCTQVYRFSQRNPADAAYICKTDVCKCVWQERWSFWAHRSPVVLVVYVCAQVYRFSQRNSADSAYLCETDASKYVRQQRWRFWARSFFVSPLLDHACTQRWRFWPPGASVLATQPDRLCLPLWNWRL
jgi:hypothetical protein